MGRREGSDKTYFNVDIPQASSYHNRAQTSAVNLALPPRESAPPQGKNHAIVSQSSRVGTYGSDDGIDGESLTVTIADGYGRR